MKTIFINGLMTERCGDFLRLLAVNHHVVGEGLRDRLGKPGLNFLEPKAAGGSHSRSDTKGSARSVFDHTEELAANLAADLGCADLSPEPRWQVSPDQVKSDLLPRVDRVLRLERVFKDFHAKQKVDLVISGSDYGSHSRIVALAARDLGIPTLNLEHGFFFSRFDQGAVEGRSVMPTLFISRYANLDNELEVEGFVQEAEAYPHLDTEFLSLGTPVETVADQKLGKDEALASLGLTGNQSRVLILGSWIEARAINSMVRGQLETIAAYEGMFASLACRPEAEQIQLMIKLHPADNHPEVFPGVESVLKEMASKAGLPEPLIFGDQLPALLSVCDAVISMGFSSVLFDAFQLDKPSVVRVLPFQAPSQKPGWQEQINTPLREGVLAAVLDGETLWDKVLGDLSSQRQTELKAARAQLRKRYNLRHRSVDEKSKAIISWIDELLG